MLDSGKLIIYGIENVAGNGEMPRSALVEKSRHWYESRTVGVTRFYAAQRRMRLLICLSACGAMAMWNPATSAYCRTGSSTAWGRFSRHMMLTRLPLPILRWNGWRKTMTLKLMVDALTALHGRVYHLTAAKDAKPPYIVWASDSDSALWADNCRAEKGTGHD